MMFLAKYWRVLAIAAGVALFAAYSWHLAREGDKRGYQRAQTEMSQRISEANAATAALEQRQREQSQKAAQAWESKRNELQSQVDGLLARKPVVRLCKPAGGAPLPGASTTPAGSHDAAGASFDTVSVGQDIGPAAVVLAAECERYRQQLSALQSWVSDTFERQGGDRP